VKVIADQYFVTAKIKPDVLVLQFPFQWKFPISNAFLNKTVLPNKLFLLVYHVFIFAQEKWVEKIISRIQDIFWFIMSWDV